MAEGTTAYGFCRTVAAQVRARFGGNFSDVLLFVPTPRVAARVRALLSEGFTGVLPAILPLKGTPELAELLGIAPPREVDTVTAKLEIARVLRQAAPREAADLFEATDDTLAEEALQGPRLWRRVEGLYTTLDRLALHGVSVHDLKRGVPAHMAGLWEQQAETLLRVARHMEHWLTRHDAVWPGAAERQILRDTAETLARTDNRWHAVVAGVMDGVPAVREVMRVCAARGGVWLPEMGPATAELLAKLAPLEIPYQPLPLVAAPSAVEAVAETDWDEAWLAALAVRRAVAEGEGRIAVVSPSRGLLARVQGILAGWGLQVTVGGRTCLHETPLGRQVLAMPHWGERPRRLVQWRELAATHGFESEDWPRVLAALDRLQPADYWLEAADWQAVLAMVMAEIPVQVPVSEGIFLLGPLDTRLLDFDTVIAAGCTEGTWPSPAFDNWLSEPHLRALGLPDAEHKALLMGSELESVLHGGNSRVVVTRARCVEGRDTVRSRFLSGYSLPVEEELTACVPAARAGHEASPLPLGAFTPQGELWPKRWSASFIEALLACPYRALGERVLKLEKPDPLTPLPDARTAGLLVHRWLERVAKLTVPLTDADSFVQAMRAVAEEELADETPVMRAIWRGKFARLAPALLAQWQADGRTLDAVEHKLTREVGPVTVMATLDRVETGAEGKVIIDFKTGTPPAWSRVAAGTKPQLALEAWLLGDEVAGLEYWHLKGYGTQPLNVESTRKLAPLLAPVEHGVTRLIATYGEGARFAAVPDMRGGGLLATGACEYCELAGVCRRKGAVEQPQGEQ